MRLARNFRLSLLRRDDTEARIDVCTGRGTCMREEGTEGGEIRIRRDFFFNNHFRTRFNTLFPSKIHCINQISTVETFKWPELRIFFPLLPVFFFLYSKTDHWPIDFPLYLFCTNFEGFSIKKVDALG